MCQFNSIAKGVPVTLIRCAGVCQKCMSRLGVSTISGMYNGHVLSDGEVLVDAIKLETPVRCKTCGAWVTIWHRDCNDNHLVSSQVTESVELYDFDLATASDA